MGGRTMPVDCEHGVTVDWGDFGPCQNCGEHELGECPNLSRCPDCDALATGPNMPEDPRLFALRAALARLRVHLDQAVADVDAAIAAGDGLDDTRIRGDEEGWGGTA